MTRSRYRIYDDGYPHFLTCTVVGWLPVFARPAMANIILDSWRFLQKEHSMRIFSYVILENHLHMVAHARDLVKIMKNFKSYTARQIIDNLKGENAGLLEQVKWLRRIAGLDRCGHGLALIQGLARDGLRSRSQALLGDAMA